MLTISLPDVQATRRLGRVMGRSLPAGSTVLLEGNLGAGKTTLVGGIGEGLGIQEPIVSPTFTLVNEYTEGRLPLYHLDLYRLEASEVEAIYPEIYWEGIEIPPGITVIEWAQRLPYCPSDYLDLELIQISQGERTATVKLVGAVDFDLSVL